MTNVIPLPGLSVEMQFSEIESLVDAMLYMHETAESSGDRKRIMDIEVALLHIIRDKIATGQRDLTRIPGHYGRKAS
ncbi:MAG: hypothetical protein ABTQ31_04540 [Rhizobiaceae bacterium]